MIKLLLLLLLVSAMGFAQASGTFYGMGGAWQQYSHPEVTGWLSYAVPLDPAHTTYSFTTYDIIPTSNNNPIIQTSVRTGFATQVKAIGPFRIFVLLDGGFASIGSATGGAIGGGIVGEFPIRRTNWHVILASRILKTSVAPGSPKNYEVGFGYMFK